MLIEKTVEKVDRKPLLYRKTQKKRKPKPFDFGYWQGREDSNLRPTVLEWLSMSAKPCRRLAESVGGLASAVRIGVSSRARTIIKEGLRVCVGIVSRCRVNVGHRAGRQGKRRKRE